MVTTNEKFADLGTPRRIWAVAAINGDLGRLCTLHDEIADRFTVGDKLLYLGNYLGIRSRDNDAVINELLIFRSALLSKPGMEPSDIVHLRGIAEEAWQRLLRLQFAQVPAQMLESLLEAGVGSYLRLYGVTNNEIDALSRAGSVTITRWTNQLRVAQRLAPGHEPLMCSMRRAAVAKGENGQTLFVPAGFDVSRTLDDQGDSLWFAGEIFRPGADTSSLPYSRIVRGYDADRSGIVMEGKALTLDGGCGSGGPLICGGFNANGKLVDIIAVGGESDIEPILREARRCQDQEQRLDHVISKPEEQRPAISA